MLVATRPPRHHRPELTRGYRTTLRHMPAHRSSEPTSSAVRALVLLHHLALELTRDAQATLGPSRTAHLDLHLLLAMHLSHGISPSELADQLHRPRATTARALARLLDEGLVTRTTSRRDTRRAELWPSAAGQARLERFAAAATATFTGNAADITQVLTLHGRDPHAPATPPSPARVLEVTQQLAKARHALAEDLLVAVQGLDLDQAVDRAAILAIADRGQPRPTQIARDLGLSPAGTTSLISRLAAKGLVVRDTDVPDDGRAVTVRPTPLGRRATRIQATAFCHNQQALLDALEQTLTHTTPTSPTPTAGAGDQTPNAR